MDDMLASYYAGFFDGEGSVHTTMYKDRHGKDRQRVTAKITQVNREVLDRLVSHLGCGAVHDKHDRRASARGWQTCYEVVFTHRAARQFLAWVEPHLLVKKDRVTAILDVTGRDSTARSTGRAAPKAAEEVQVL